MVCHLMATVVLTQQWILKIMSNTYEETIDEMIIELNGIKDGAIDSSRADVHDLLQDASHSSVQSVDGRKVVINLNFNKNSEFIESSVCDKSGDENDEPDNSRRSPDGPPRRPSSGSASDARSHSSGANESNESADSSQRPSNQTFKCRPTRRTISESSNEAIARGILKYPHNWIRRTVSESSCDVIVENGSDFDLLFSSVEDIYSDDDIAGEHQMGAKKNVRFSDNVSKTIYRPNSSILGRKLKNQKRSKARKNSHRKDSLTENVSKIPPPKGRPARGRGRGRGRPPGRPPKKTTAKKRPEKSSKKQTIDDKSDDIAADITGHQSVDSHSRIKSETIEFDENLDTESLTTHAIASFVSPGAQPLHRNEALNWKYKVNLIGEKVVNPRIHCCDKCLLPILVYGRM
ncbi:unnamed protein product, partial [Oppiella nova]